MAGPILLGVEIGGTKLQIGLGRGDGQLLALRRSEVVPGRGARVILETIERTVNELLEETGLERPVAIGIGFGGPVDATRGVVLKSNHVAGWDGFPLAEWAVERLSVPVAMLHNDSDVAALGEARFGAGGRRSPLLYVNSGSGVGGGLIIDGRIYRGAGLGALEIGHTALGDPEQGTGPSLEEVSSGWAIGREGRAVVEAGAISSESRLWRLCEGRSEEVTGELVGRAAIEGDPAAIAILYRAARAMGAALAFAVNLIAPARVVLGGGVAQLPESLWLTPIRAAAEERIYKPLRGELEIVAAELGQEVVVRGALSLASDASRKLATE